MKILGNTSIGVCCGLVPKGVSLVIAGQATGLSCQELLLPQRRGSGRCPVGIGVFFQRAFRRFALGVFIHFRIVVVWN